MSLTVEALAKEIHRLVGIHADELATALLPFIERHIAAGQQGAGCGACGDGCKDRISCRLADESPKPAGAVPLPEPSGYIRIKNGQYQIQVGGEEPHDRGNGHHGPWVHIFDTQTLRDYGDARAAEGRVSMRAASLWPSRWTVELHPNKANAFRIIHRDGRRTDYTGPKDADLKLMWELILDTLEESHV